MEGNRTLHPNDAHGTGCVRVVRNEAMVGERDEYWTILYDTEMRECPQELFCCFHGAWP